MLRFHKVCIIALSRSGGIVGINPVPSADQAVKVVYRLLGSSHQRGLMYRYLLSELQRPVRRGKASNRKCLLRLPRMCR